jgi:hypothetical protein
VNEAIELPLNQLEGKKLRLWCWMRTIIKIQRWDAPMHFLAYFSSCQSDKTAGRLQQKTLQPRLTLPQPSYVYITCMSHMYHIHITCISYLYYNPIYNSVKAKEAITIYTIVKQTSCTI